MPELTSQAAVLANGSVTANLVIGEAYVRLPAELGGKAAAVLEISAIYADAGSAQTANQRRTPVWQPNWRARSPPMYNAGALFDSEAAPSPTTAIVPPEMPMSTSRPSPRRQLIGQECNDLSHFQARLRRRSVHLAV